MTRVAYTGPPGQTNVEVGLATGRGDVLEPGEYDVPDDLAKRLVSSSSAWEPVGGQGGPTVSELRKQAKTLGLEVPSRATKSDLIDAIAAAEAAAAAAAADDEGDSE